MNRHFHGPYSGDTTLTAADLMHRRWSVAEIESMTAAGLILEDERFELIDGEVVPMPAKGNRHELLKVALNRLWSRMAPDDIFLAQETTFRINHDTFLEPDFVFYHRDVGLVNLKPATTLLAVEVSDTSLGFDLGRKSRVYAAQGVRELWVINANKLETHVHRSPGKLGYGSRKLTSASEILLPDFAPVLAVALAELELV